MESQEDEMSFLDHLEVLRWHLIRSILAILIAAIGAFIFKGFIFDTVIFGPKKPDFLTYRLLCKLSDKMSEIVPSMFPDGAICIGQDLPSLVNLTMAGQFSAHIMTALVAGLVIAFPFIIWEVWRFIMPGLKATERKYARGFVASTSFLFISGVLFGYYVICPLSVNFFLNYQVSEEVLNNPTLSTYVSLITTVVLACGAVFELPVAVYFLTKAGILSPKVLRAFRRHSIVGALIVSAVITPPDIFSQILVTIPILILYELSIWISGVVMKQQAQ
ncbi:MAG: twin-arginine translocase subunit TatC [Flavobacteriales bacterium]